MSEAELKEMEKRWEETRRDTDGFRYLKLLEMRGVEESFFLKERVRVGDLDPKRLELAAALNHKAALEALERKGTPLPVTPREWFRRLARTQPRPFLVRALLCLALRVQPDSVPTAVAHQLELATEWCDDPESKLSKKIHWEADYAPQGSWTERAAYIAIEGADTSTQVEGEDCPPRLYGASDKLFHLLQEEGMSDVEIIEIMWHDLKEWALH